MMIKVSKDLKKEEIMFGQTNNSIEKIDKRITKVQNFFTRLPDIAYITSAATVGAVAITVQAQTLQASTIQILN